MASLIILNLYGYQLFTKITIDEAAPGLKTIFSFRVPDQRSGKFEVDILNNGFNMLYSDKDVWELLDWIAREHPTMLHVYFEHGVNILDFCPMESQSTAPLTAEGVDIVGATKGGSISGDIDAHVNSINDEAEVHCNEHPEAQTRKGAVGSEPPNNENPIGEDHIYEYIPVE
ncbi:Mitochondrial outer membrane protein porin of 34 kDa [Morella rubra]|uniref:Mitochondrial outer membrane protein porin of 34 kDa n=1 Tax=Morella rubra TaxID=262757 RepID=A0A6A1VUF9_9ROSI|nr:Mitochondrial outer membrane protein porin of 34 kDa [Morella rubra]